MHQYSQKNDVLDSYGLLRAVPSNFSQKNMTS